MKKAVIISLLALTGCRPCAVPDICLPSGYMQENCVDHCMSDLPEANLANWWEQFDDALLISLIEKGIACNYDLRIAREKICESRAIYRADKAILFPWVDAFAQFNRMRNSQTLAEAPFTGGSYVNYYQVGFDSFWEIDLFGKNVDRTQAACYDVAAQQAQVRDVHVSVASEVAINYFRIRSLQERIEITETHIAAETELLELVKDRYAAGLISQLDIYLTEALLKERQANLAGLVEEFYQTVYALGVLVSEFPSTIVNSFCDTKKLPCIEARFPLGFPSELLCRRGDIREAEFKMRAAGARVMSAQKEFFPTISLESLYSYATGFFTQWLIPSSRQWSVNPGITLPIFHGGDILAHIAFENSLQRQAVLTYEQKVLEAVQEVETALVGFFQEGQRIQSFKDEVADYREARTIALELYTGGIVDFLFVIDTERDLFISEIQLSGSKEDMMTQLVAVYKALGGGWECCD